MTIKEFNEKYYLHDSCITNIAYNSEEESLVIILDFCQWAQKWYKKEDPENVFLKVTFSGIPAYDGLTGEIDYFSVLDAEIRNGYFRMNLLDDIHNETYELQLNPSQIFVDVAEAD